MKGLSLFVLLVIATCCTAAPIPFASSASRKDDFANTETNTNNFRNNFSRGLSYGFGMSLGSSLIGEAKGWLQVAKSKFLMDMCPDGAVCKFGQYVVDKQNTGAKSAQKSTKESAKGDTTDSKDAETNDENAAETDDSLKFADMDPNLLDPTLQDASMALDSVGNDVAACSTGGCGCGCG